MTKQSAANRPLMGACSRRDFLKLSGITAFSAGGMMFLAGCGPAAQDSGAADEGSAGSGSSEGSGTLGDGTTLRVGMEAAYAPYNWQVSEASDYTIPIENVDGAYADGYDVQAAKIIADALGMEAVAVKCDFSALIDMLNNGQIDIICAGMSVTPDREDSAIFCNSYIDDDISMVTRKDSPYASATTFADLAGASIMGQAATMYNGAPLPLNFCHGMEGDSRLPRTFRTVDFHYPAPWITANTKCLVDCKRTAGNRRNLHVGSVPHAHDRTLTKVLFNLLKCFI